MQTIYTSVQTDAPTPRHSTFAGRMLFLMPNQQYKSTEGKKSIVESGRQRYGICLSSVCPVFLLKLMQYVTGSSLRWLAYI